jgi:hypothetical protein
MRTFVLVWVVLLAVLCGAPLGAQDNPFLGRWDLTVTTPKESYPLWLEVREEGGQLIGYFQDRTGSVHKLAEIAREGAELVFSPGAPSRPGAPKPVHRARVEDGKLVGVLTRGLDTLPWVGVRPPKWAPATPAAARAFGPEVALFNGRDLAGWMFQNNDQPGGWVVADGVLTNEKPGNNIISTESFKDFSLSMEYKLEKDSNSGLYLRGRYELQVLDDAGKPPSLTGHMSVYGRVAPLVNASKPAGEWQTVEVTLVGNRVTVVLNGKKVQDNAVIDGITGGALNSDEGAPGPIMIQGDHSKIWVRRLVVKPIK